MKYLLINAEKFKEGGYSETFRRVYYALVANGTILSEEATTTALKAIFEEGIIAGANEWTDQHEYWNTLKKDL